MSLKQRISALIFVAGEEGISLASLAEVLDCQPDQVLSQLAAIQNDLQEDPDSPIRVQEFNHHYLFVTKEALEEDVKAFAHSPHQQRLTRPALETLAIIAYRQPITRMAIEEIRGVSSQALVQKLVSRDLVREVGRIEAPGRPILYGVTDYFLNYFGLESLDDLPEIESLALNAKLVTEEIFFDNLWIIHEREVD